MEAGRVDRVLHREQQRAARLKNAPELARSCSKGRCRRNSTKKQSIASPLPARCHSLVGKISGATCPPARDGLVPPGASGVIPA